MHHLGDVLLFLPRRCRHSVVFRLGLCINVLRFWWQYDTDDAGYKAVDAALRQLLQRKECQWISVTTSDNAYGSEVQSSSILLLPHWCAAMRTCNHRCAVNL